MQDRFIVIESVNIAETNSLVVRMFAWESGSAPQLREVPIPSLDVEVVGVKSSKSDEALDAVRAWLDKTLGAES